jgi:hypothetical protein
VSIASQTKHFFHRKSCCGITTSTMMRHNTVQKRKDTNPGGR